MSAASSSRSDTGASSNLAARLSLNLAVASLAGGLLLASRWHEKLDSALTHLALGRVVLAIVVLSLTLTIFAERASRVAGSTRVFSVTASAPLLALALGAVVIAASALTRGQNSAGALSGYLEVALVTVACAVVVRRRPDRSRLLLTCAAGGALLGCLEALARNATTDSVRGATGRLAGYYENPNLLGFAGSLAVPIFLVFALRARGPRAAAYWIALAGTSTGIMLSYSRGAILASMLGVVAVLALARPTRAARLRFVAVGCAALAVFAAAAYPLYLRLRTHADFAAAATAGTPDRSGWDPRTEGLLPAGPSRLTNPSGGALRIDAVRRGEGASLPLGALPEGQRYLLKAKVASPIDGLEIELGLEDNLLGAGPAFESILVGPRPRMLRLRWSPARPSPNARLYVWLPRGGTAILYSARFGRAGATGRLLPLRLLGPSDSTGPRASESRYVHSREDAASLAVELFAEHPLTGVGWQRFTVYSAAKLHYGALATHDEYLRYAAELGLPGVVFLLLLVAALVRAGLRAHETDVGRAAASCLVVGAIGLIFVNALEVPTIALPLAVSAAVLCSRSAAAGRGHPTPAPNGPGRTS